MYTKRKIIAILIFINLFCFSLILDANAIYFLGTADSKQERATITSSSSPSAFLKAQQLWSIIWGGTNNDNAYGVTVDSSDNVYIVGQTCSFGDEDGDAFLIKYDSSGNMEWSTTWGGSNEEECYGVAVDSSDNIYITGLTRSFADFDGDAFLVKYNSSGDEEWFTLWGGGNRDFAWSVAVDTADDIYIAGTTKSFDDTTLGDMFIAKYNGSAYPLWSQTKGANNYLDDGRGVAIDSMGNAYLVGSSGSRTFFVKYDSSGNEQWTELLTFGKGGGATVNSLDNIYIVGSTASFGAGKDDAFVAKYDSSGTELWKSSWGGEDGDEGKGVAVDSSGNVYIAGQSFSADPNVFLNDAFLARFDNSGVQQWNTTWGGEDGWDYGQMVAIDSSDNVYLAGFTSSFGSDNSIYDAFLNKYSQSELTSTGDGSFNILDFLTSPIGWAIIGIASVVVIAAIVGIIIIVIKKRR